MRDAIIDNRMARYQENQHIRGFTQIKIWLPLEDVPKFKKMAQSSRRKHTKLLLN